jgi:hypothetical protein
MTALRPDVPADLSQENIRLQAELRAAEERQIATAEILHTIASIPGDAGLSLQQIAELTAAEPWVYVSTSGRPRARTLHFICG